MDSAPRFQHDTLWTLNFTLHLSVIKVAKQQAEHIYIQPYKWCGGESPHIIIDPDTRTQLYAVFAFIPTGRAHSTQLTGGHMMLSNILNMALKRKL
jgi:hypothetical protein